MSTGRERNSKPKVAVIGAGPCGLVSTKILKSLDLELECFEKGSQLGGLWRFQNDNGVSAAYSSLRIDSSKERLAFSDFPMPSEYPDYPHHSQVCRYLENYAQHFSLEQNISFRTEVKKVTYHGPEDFELVLQKRGEAKNCVKRFSHVLVCNGHHWKPHIPDFQGLEDASWIHSHSYKEPSMFRGKSVLVLGMGNSAVDIASDAAPLARRVFVSTRRGAYILPRYIFGRPTDQWSSSFTSRLPRRLKALLIKCLLSLSRGSQNKFGLPYPSHSFWSQHPTMSDEFLEFVRDKKIRMKGQVTSFEGSRALFDDDSSEEIDLVVLATGYSLSFPFLDEETFKSADYRVSLYQRVVAPERPGLYFIGLIQPNGPIFPLAEAQAKWVGALVSGQLQLPSHSAMEDEIRNYQKWIDREYLPTRRHSLQVDFVRYGEELRRLYQQLL